jgi:hypothetical protein
MYDPYWKIMPYKVVRKMRKALIIITTSDALRASGYDHVFNHVFNHDFKCSVKSQSGWGIHKIRGLGQGDSQVQQCILRISLTQ